MRHKGMRLRKQNKMYVAKNIEKKTTAILVDYENVYITLDRCYVKKESLDLRSKVITKIKKLYNSDKICHTKLFLDFQKISLEPEEFNLFKYNHISLNHVYSGKNASDIYLMLDIMKILEYDTEIDRFVIISSDSDMLPIINELKTRRKEVIVGYFETNTDEEYVKYLRTITDKCFSIESLLNLETYKEKDMNKFKIEEMEKLLPWLDKLISDTYKQYIKKSGNGDIISAGTLNKGRLRDELLKNGHFVKEDIKSGFVIESLLTDNVLCEYNVPGVAYKPILIDQQYLSDNRIDFNITITEDDYKYLKK